MIISDFSRMKNTKSGELIMTKSKSKVVVLDFDDNVVDIGETSKISKKYFEDCRVLGVSFRSMGKNTIYNRPLNKKFLKVIL